MSQIILLIQKKQSILAKKKKQVIQQDREREKQLKQKQQKQIKRLFGNIQKANAQFHYEQIKTPNMILYLSRVYTFYDNEVIQQLQFYDQSHLFVSTNKILITCSLQQKIILIRFINSINQKKTSGTVLFNPRTGVIQFRYCVYIQNLLKFNHRKIAYDEFQYNIYALLSIINKIPYKMEKLFRNKQQYRKFHTNQQINIIKLIQKELNISNIHHQLFNNKQVKSSNVKISVNKSQSQQNQQKINPINLEIAKQYKQQLQLSTIHFQNSDHQASYEYLLQNESPVFLEYLVPPVVKSVNSNQLPYLYMQIRLDQSSQKWQLLSQSEIATIYKGKPKFSYILTEMNARNKKQQQKVMINKLMIKKKYKHQTDYRKQRQILNLISQSQSVYIPKHYYSSDPKYNSIIFMDFYTFKSFDRYLESNYLTCSISTKVYLLCQIVQALRFLKDSNITYLNLTPKNILIGKFLIARLSNFRNSYNQRLKNKIELPQSKFLQYNIDLNSISYKIDVYSFGMLLNDVLYSLPLNRLKIKLKNKKNNQQQQKFIEKFMNIPPQSLKFYSPLSVSQMYQINSKLKAQTIMDINYIKRTIEFFTNIL